MQYVRQAGSDPRFLRKALNEASGELQQQFYGIPRPLLLEPGAGDDDEDRVLEEFHFYRRHSSYMLWELGDAGWERTALHPYRGEVSVTHLAREMYRHDLEHLWQARRMIEALAAR